MRAGRELVSMAHENFVASFAKLAEHSAGGEHRRFGSVFAYLTRLPISLFNGCVVAEECAPGDVDAALRWVAGHEVPMRLFVVDELAHEPTGVAAGFGLERDPVPYPGMVLHPLPEAPAPPADVAVDVVGLSELDEFRGVFMAQGGTRELAEQMFPESLLGDVDVQAFVGRLEGSAVGYSLAIRSERAGGVYNVGTLPEARRRGVGTATTWAAVDAARKAGLDCVVLQSTQMGLPIYEAMGFRTVVRYAVFGAPVRPTGQETPVPPSPRTW